MNLPRAWGPPTAAAAGVEVWLRAPLPRHLEIGAASALFLHGAVTAPERVGRVELELDRDAHPVLASGMPSPGLAAQLGDAAASRSIFWGVLPLLGSRFEVSHAEVAVVVELERGDRVRVPIGSIDTSPSARVAATPPTVGPRTIAICMATHEPPVELLARQLDSLRRQTHDDWICLISDDASSPAGLAEIERLVGDDSRFLISPAQTRAGAYENFHRALAMVPTEVRHVALCDQDDEWYADKLEVLLAAIGDAWLVFSDMRIVDADRRPIAATYWTARQHNHENFASLLLGNTVTGAASLFRRELLDQALPLPPRVGNLYHDHWLALVARALGRISYVDRPLYDYVQHAGAVLGHAGANRGVVGGSLAQRIVALRHRPRGRLRTEWRRIYFAEYCRVRLVARVLLDRFGERIGSRERRTLRLIERGEGSAPFITWLTVRQLRRLRRDDTLGSEAGMLRGLAWSRAMRLRSRRADPLDDADLPAGIVGPEAAETRSPHDP